MDVAGALEPSSAIGNIVKETDVPFPSCFLDKAHSKEKLNLKYG